MNLLHKILLTCALCAGQLVYSQEPTYTWGDPATNDFPERRIDQLLSLGDDGFVLLRKYVAATTVATYWVEYYDSNLNLVGNTEVDFYGGVMGDFFDIEEISVVNEKIYAFISHWDKAAQSNTMSLKELGLDGTLTNIVDLDIIRAEKMGNRGMYQMAFSDDGSKLLILSELPFVKKTNEKIRLSCYDLNNFNQIWSHHEELTFESPRAANNEIAVDNNGQAYIFKRIWEKPVWNYALYTYNGKDQWNSNLKLGLEGKEIVDYVLDFNQLNEFILFASYTTKPSAYNKDLHGSWFVHISSNLDLDVNETSKWNMEMVAYFMGDRIAMDDEKSRIEDFEIKDVLVRDDGNLLVLLEQVKMDNKPIAGSSPIQYTYEWNYGPALALCLNPRTGDQLWWQSFNKNQKIISNEDVDYYGSFVYYLKEDRLYALWNNTDLSIPSIPAANWTEPDGTNYVKHKAFDDKTMHATFMQIIEPDGSLAYSNRKFGLPLFNLHQGAVFEMSMTSPFYFSLNGDLVIMASMHNGGKRYRFGFVGL